MVAKDVFVCCEPLTVTVMAGGVVLAIQLDYRLSPFCMHLRVALGGEPWIWHMPLACLLCAR